MSKELELWTFIAKRLRSETVMLLVVAESSGSSPGRAGYKMAVAADGELIGSIGGGVMEVNLVEEAKQLLSSRQAGAPVPTCIFEQEHRKNSKHPSGMICSGRQTVILKELTQDDVATVERVIEALSEAGGCEMMLGNTFFSVRPNSVERPELMPGGYEPILFERDDENFKYSEELDVRDRLYIIGGGHCALALSELMSKMDFRISIFDDRPSLNTLEKNGFVDDITVIESYDNIGPLIPRGDDVYVVVMTIGYASDGVVVRKLIDHDVKYLGVLGSKAKVAMLMKELKTEGFAADELNRLHAPIGVPINSRTPEEIAVSIAAEIISVRNANG